MLLKSINRSADMDDGEYLDVVANGLDCNIVVSKFKLYAFWFTNYLVERHELLYPRPAID